ncbi:efflux RND transporter permease subunit [Polycladidibacter stylochi]|uniref:efflux RND transporter permease subunit n=1 Tax=Polycladidibacter stylochi TaxID=1807766 RepID=UPI0009E88377|nr:efflux RND transporter permease subunit [Pseudovibrio stylochi]
MPSHHQNHSLSEICIRRPVLTIVLNLLVLTAGIAALMGVEVREMPNVDKPVISITTVYKGAPPEVIDAEVTSTIEKAIARISGIRNISSSSRYGRSRITVEFSEDILLSDAANDVRDAVSSVERRLPDDVEAPTVVKADADADPVLRAVITSSKWSIEQLSHYVDDVVIDRLTAVDGVASISEYGKREPVFKVAVDLQAMASRGITLPQLRAALVQLTADTSAGSLTTSTQDLYVRARSDVQTATEIAAVQLDRNTKIADIALVTKEPRRATSGAFINGNTAISLGVIRSAGSNTLDISKGVRKAIDQLNRQMPAHLKLQITSDDALFISGALSEVVKSIILSTIIVVAIILLFLRSLKLTLIPALTVPLALVGSITGLWLMGFSINVLTLLALLLATGMVVDDSIVVLENISKRVQRGDKGFHAAIVGTREVFFAVITTTATLVAVFLPISFLPGSVGKLFSEFGFVLAICMVLSSFVALTLAPMLAARFLCNEKASKTEDETTAENAAQSTTPFLVRLGEALAAAYHKVLRTSLGRPKTVLLVSLLFCMWGGFEYNRLPSELTPKEDRALLLMRIIAPQGVSLDYTRDKITQIESIIAPVIESGEAQSLLTIIGTGGSLNSGFMIMPLSPWGERERSQQEIANDIRAKLKGLVGTKVFIFQTNTLGIRGAGQGLSFAVTGSNYKHIADGAEQLVAAMKNRLGDKIGAARISFETTQPQLLLHVDRERASDLGLSADMVTSSLRMLLDGSDVAELFVNDDGLPIVIEAGGAPLRSTRDLENLFIKSPQGQMLPLSTLMSIEEEAVAPSLPREGQSRAVPVTVSLSDNYHLAQAITDLQQIAKEVLPHDLNVTLLSDAAVLQETNSSVLLTFAFAILVVFLVLAAQFESFMSAIVILLTVPFGIASAFIAMHLTAGSMNVYSQIGIILLVGLMAKNGILIVEFANALKAQGMEVKEAILNASLIRLRPVAMTVISTVLGAVPLVLAFGAGAEAREQLGWVIVGGLGFATLATMFVTPVIYMLLAPLSAPK